MNFDDDIKRITNEVIQDGTVEKMVRERIVKGFDSAIESAFLWGDLKKVIESRVNDILVPYIEKYDMADYIVKLDAVLQDIINSTTLQDNKRILENFHGLMTEPEKKVVTLEEIFERYKKHVAEYVDTDELKVRFGDGEPSYEWVEVSAAIDKEDDEWYKSCFEYGYLNLIATTSNSETKDMCYSIRFARYKGEKESGWNIRYDSDPNINNLRTMPEFEVFLLRLGRANVKLQDTDICLEDEVEPDKKPEPIWE